MSSEKKPFLVFEFLASRNPIEKEEDYDFLWSGGRSDATSVLVELTIKYVCQSPPLPTTTTDRRIRYFFIECDGQTNSWNSQISTDRQFGEVTGELDGQIKDELNFNLNYMFPPYLLTHRPPAGRPRTGHRPPTQDDDANKNNIPTMKMTIMFGSSVVSTSLLLATSIIIIATNSMNWGVSSFSTSSVASLSFPLSTLTQQLLLLPQQQQQQHRRHRRRHLPAPPPLQAGGWGNNQERSLLNEEFGGVNGSPIYDTYEIEDRGQFMQRVNNERKSLRIKKAADLLEVARIAGVELKRKEKDPERLDLFDAEDLKSGDDYLDVSI